MKHTMTFMGLILASIFVLFLSSCTTAPKKRPPQQANPSAKTEFQKIEIAIATGSPRSAIKRLNRLIKANPDTDIADDAYILLGKVYYDHGDYDNSYKAYISVVNSDIFSPRESVAMTGAARSLYRMGRLDEALALTDKGLNARNLDELTKIEIYKLRFSLLNQLGDKIDALRAAIKRP